MFLLLRNNMEAIAEAEAATLPEIWIKEPDMAILLELFLGGLISIF